MPDTDICEHIVESWSRQHASIDLVCQHCENVIPAGKSHMAALCEGWVGAVDVLGLKLALLSSTIYIGRSSGSFNDPYDGGALLTRKEQ